MKLRINLAVFVSTLVMLATPTEVLAVMQSLNGQTGQTQTFQNDSNIIINSLNNIHSLNWQGLLPVSRGGTGASTFTAGSLLFSNGTSFSQDNSNLFWDDTNNRLGIGTTQPTSALDVFGNASISGNLGVSELNTTFIRSGDDIVSPNGISIEGGSVTGADGNAGPIALISGAASTGNGKGGDIFLVGGPGGDISGNGGVLAFYGGDAVGGSSDGGSISFRPGRAWGSGTVGHVRITDPVTSNQAFFDTTLLTTIKKTFTFPDASGTFGLLETDQIWSGLNRFEASTNSTIYVGSSVKSGCIALGDSDGIGVTYVTANDGVLTASTTKPSICQ